MIARRLHGCLTANDGRGDPGEPRRFTTHLVSLSATKIADGLIDPKLVLAWILSALGAPGYLIGALVPVREAGALLPQIALAQWIQSQRGRKWFWAAGSALQGLAALGIAAAAAFLEGAVAGWVILGLLAVLATARASCSASYKDVLARTVSKGARGTVSGTAGSMAAAAVLAYALLLGFGIVPRGVWAVSIFVALAGALWLLAAAVFSTLDEPVESDTKPPEIDPTRLVRPLWEDSELRSYVAARGLLIATALAPPFLVMLGNAENDRGLGNLGAFIVASSAAAILSSYVWGRLSDVSSRKTLMFSGAIATAVLAAAAATGFLTGGLGGAWMAAGFLFVAQLAYEGVRAGRKTHLTDMDTGGQKAVYTALSNTLIGILLLAGGLFGVLADLAGAETVLAVFAGFSAVAVVVSLGLSEVQDDA